MTATKTRKIGICRLLAGALTAALLVALASAVPASASPTPLIAASASVSVAAGGENDGVFSPFTDAFHESFSVGGTNGNGSLSVADQSLDTVLGFEGPLDDLRSITTRSVGTGQTDVDPDDSTAEDAKGLVDQAIHFDSTGPGTMFLTGSMESTSAGEVFGTCAFAQLVVGGAGVVGGTRQFTVSQGDPGTDCALLPPTSDLSLDERIQLQDGAVGITFGSRFTAPEQPGKTNASGASFDLDFLIRECTITVTEPNQVTNGTPDDDVICGTDGSDEIYGHGGDDLIFGGGGDDDLFGGDDDDEIHGGDDDDVILGGEGNDEIYGEEGNDGQRTTPAFDSYLAGGPGDDEVFGGAGTDEIVGRCGENVDGLEPVCPGPVESETDSDILRGGPDADGISGDGDSDFIFGEGGGDVLFGDGGPDIIDGGQGNEVAPDGSPGIDGGSGDDILRGGDNDDLIAGSLGADDIFGDAGSDKLRGDGNRDCIIGGPRKDVFVGGPGNDKMKAKDGTRDIVHGNGGSNDKAKVDDKDRVSGVERLSPRAFQCALGF